MKKKMVCMLLVLCMAVGLCACGNAKNAGDEAKASVEDSEVTKDTTQEEKDWLYFPYENRHFYYSMMLPSDVCRDAGYGMECWLDGVKRGEVIYVTQYAADVGDGSGDEFQKENIDMSSYNSSADIFDLLIKNFEHESALGYDFELEDYEVEVLKTEVINGLEMTKFQASLMAKHESTGDEIHVFPVVAYGIKTEKTPVLISCIDRTVVGLEKRESTHEEWVSKFDDIVATFEE